MKLASRLTREKQLDNQSSTNDFNSRNKMTVTKINILNNV